MDTVLSNAFYVLHIFYVLDERFKDERGHVMHTLLSFGFLSSTRLASYLGEGFGRKSTEGAPAKPLT